MVLVGRIMDDSPNFPTIRYQISNTITNQIAYKSSCFDLNTMALATLVIQLAKNWLQNQ